MGPHRLFPSDNWRVAGRLFHCRSQRERAGDIADSEEEEIEPAQEAMAEIPAEEPEQQDEEKCRRQ